MPPGADSLAVTSIAPPERVLSESLTFEAMDRLDRVPVLAAGTLPVEQPGIEAAAHAAVDEAVRQQAGGQFPHRPQVLQNIALGLVHDVFEQPVDAAHRGSAAQLR